MLMVRKSMYERCVIKSSLKSRLFFKGDITLKKLFLIYMNLCAMCFFSSCKEKSPATANDALPTQSVASSDGSKIDYDLASMNANMLYAEVFNMMIEPEIYDEKTVRMKGNFASYPNSPTANGGTAYAVVISDALACCQSGIEFKYDFGENLPKEGEEITVTGRYVTAFLDGDLATIM